MHKYGRSFKLSFLPNAVYQSSNFPNSYPSSFSKSSPTCSSDWFVERWWLTYCWPAITLSQLYCSHIKEEFKTLFSPQCCVRVLKVNFPNSFPSFFTNSSPVCSSDWFFERCWLTYCWPAMFKCCTFPSMLCTSPKFKLSQFLSKFFLQLFVFPIDLWKDAGWHFADQPWLNKWGLGQPYHIFWSQRQRSSANISSVSKFQSNLGKSVIKVFRNEQDCLQQKNK